MVRERAGLGREGKEGKEGKKGKKKSRADWCGTWRVGEGGKGTGKQESEEEEGRDNEARLLVYD